MKNIAACGISALLGIALGFAVNVSNLSGSLNVFTQIGEALRALSLSSAAGNAGAWAIYVVLCILPLLGLLPIRRKRGCADLLFALASVYGIWMWRMLANPTRLMPSYIPGFEAAYGAMSGTVLLSFVIGGLLLRLAENVSSDTLLSRASGVLLGIAVLTSLAEGVLCASLVRSTQGGVEIGYVLWLCICSAAQGTASVWTLLGAVDLLSAMRAGWFRAENAKRADTLAKRAQFLLVVTVVASLLANIATLFMTGSVSSANVQFSLPIIELIEAMCCMLLARFISAGVRIKAENDEFV